MRRTPALAVLGLSLAACSSGASVEMFQVGAHSQPGCPAPQERVFAYRTCTSMFDPFGWSTAPYQIMQDAAATAPLLALGPAAGAAPLVPVGLSAAQGLQQRLTGALATQTQVIDQQRALLEFGQLLATAPQAGAPGATLPQQTLEAALASRLTRIVGGAAPATTVPDATKTMATNVASADAASPTSRPPRALNATRTGAPHLVAAAPPAPSAATVRLMAAQAARTRENRAAAPATWHVARR
jgi:hypothetical protein